MIEESGGGDQNPEQQQAGAILKETGHLYTQLPDPDQLAHELGTVGWPWIPKES
jgi:hypothetical protein